jgi:hypothetical protein
MYCLHAYANIHTTIGTSYAVTRARALIVSVVCTGAPVAVFVMLLAVMQL